jgi:hypothetical protein
MMKQGVDERAGGMPWCWVHHHSRRFVHHHQVIIVVED